MQKSEIRTRIRNVLDEETVDDSHWSDERIDRFMNEGLGDASSRLPPSLLPALADVDTKNLSIDIQLYDMPTGYSRTTGIKLWGEDATIVPLIFESVLSKNTLYLPSTLNSFAIIPYQSNQLKIFPSPVSLVTDGFAHHFIREIAVMVNDSDIPELPALTHQWIVDYGVARALAEDGYDIERSKMFMEVYLGHFKGSGGSQ